jgi:hypothetical protein
MIIVRLLSPEPVGWLAPPTLLGHRSRHCHGINSTQYQKAPTFAVGCEPLKNHTYQRGAPL